MNKKHWSLALILFATGTLLNLGDLALSLVGIGLGYHELNPLSSTLHSELLGAVAGIAIYQVIITLLLYVYPWVRGIKRWWLLRLIVYLMLMYALLALIVLKALAVVSNIFVITLGFNALVITSPNGLIAFTVTYVIALILLRRMIIRDVEAMGA